METIRVHDAKTHFSALLARVEQGEEIVLARGDKPIARLVPLEVDVVRPLGFVDVRIPDELFDDLPDDELAAWEQ
ncbi:type II toxin-antitoxin system Phd/YefM family antitoxin [Blastococcus sp. Marseille-P5729]|uniref:type II toxin-antitoxin system Phd/YefM family antitoxin n=1 Tax=Blastococcus sp. Marseille-P5729 TaxID=2086582 RepID=UPI000D1131DA|nr:type II toxin-antitoxin system prevent-host-death family antitoxin [Blastococcus sp. Marseille-P5729]